MKVRVCLRKTYCRKSDLGKSDCGLKLTSKVRETLADFCCPLMSSNVLVNPQTFVDILGVTDSFHNLLLNLLPDLFPNVRGLAFSQILTSPRMSAKDCGRIIRGLSRTNVDSKKSVRMWRIFEDSLRPQMSAIGLSAIELSAIGLSWT